MAQFDHYTWSQGFSRYSKAWDELVTARQLNPSLAPDWVDLSLQAHQLQQNASLLVAMDAGSARAIVPLLRCNESILGIPLRTLGVGSNLTAYHPSLATHGLDREAAEQIIGGRIGRRWDAFRFHAALDPGDTLEALRAAARKLDLYWVELPGDRSPYLTIDQSWADYLAARSSNFRYNLQRKAKKFNKVPGAQFEWISATHDLRDVMQRVLDIEAASWKAEQGVAISQNPAERRYYEALLPALASKGALVMNLLSIGDEPVAYTLCCHLQGWMGLLKTSFKSRFGDTAAGNHSMNEMVRRAFELGAREFDFLGGEDNYKLEWSSSVRNHVDFLCFSKTPRGRLVTLIAMARQLARGLNRKRLATELTKVRP